MFFFFKQKSAYEIRLSLVGSEMCVGDRPMAVVVVAVVAVVVAVVVVAVVAVVVAVAGPWLWLGPWL